MRIFLTGASGYIGLHVLCELLTAGHEVTALVRSPLKLGSYAHAPNLRIVTADLARQHQVLRALAGHHVCVHVALVWGQPDEELELRDTVFSAKLFDAAGKAGIARCIFMSSVAVHRPFAEEMSDDERLSATDYYGATKAAGELFLRAACTEHQMTGIVIRPGPVVGLPAFSGGSFRSDHRLAGMVASAMEARPLEVLAGDGRQLSDVATVAKVTRMLASADNPHPVYICVDRAIFTWEWIAQKIVACVGSSSEVRVLPPIGERPIPRFCPARIEELLGGPSDASGALTEHILHLMQSSAG
ncbi:NAD(P)-dependent oxidoreductase [Mesorhizobium loti]|nr:NAD(P)-dependent oxidoreductase [Mesorhizobium loti]